MSALPQGPRIVVFGAGAVGATIGGWLTPHHPKTWLVDLPAVAQALNDKGLTLYCSDTPAQREHVKVQATGDLKSIPRPDVVLLCTKTYSLDKVCPVIKSAWGDDILVVGFQNGVDNQKVLPQYFKRTAYGIVAYNAWIDAPGVVGFQKKGPLVMGTPDNSWNAELEELADLMSRGVETVVTEELTDAAHSKMVVNLANSLTTLIGHKIRPLSDDALFQKLLTNLTAEGVGILRAAGYHEVRLGGMPSWLLMRAAAKLPRCLTKRAFDKNVKKMVMSSMAQDILQRGGKDSELESLNGYFIKLADRYGVNAPFNRAVYRLCREGFAQPGFQPLDVKEVWRQVQAQLKQSSS